MISSWISSAVFASPSSSTSASDGGFSTISVMRLFKSSACCSSLSRSSSTLMTASSAVIVSDGSTSSLRKKMSILLGIGIARAPNALSNVLFPQPFRPIRPYRLPWLRTTWESSSKTAPICCRVKFATLMSLARASTPFRLAANVQIVPAAANASEASWSIPSSCPDTPLVGPPPAVASTPFRTSFASNFLLLPSSPSSSSNSPLSCFLAFFFASRLAFAKAFFSSLDNFFSKTCSSPPPMAVDFVNRLMSTASSSRPCSSRSNASAACFSFFSCQRVFPILFCFFAVALGSWYLMKKVLCCNEIDLQVVVVV
mmetsp:Transcript_7646/g.18893  ORF Transcript_7646/g.18893 Transcript_7646/m.18893 type:complete len:313 (+) Transcript_7646:1689-2627(+)